MRAVAELNAVLLEPIMDRNDNSAAGSCFRNHGARSTVAAQANDFIHELNAAFVEHRADVDCIFCEFF